MDKKTKCDELLDQLYRLGFRVGRREVEALFEKNNNHIHTNIQFIRKGFICRDNVSFSLEYRNGKDGTGTDSDKILHNYTAGLEREEPEGTRFVYQNFMIAWKETNASDAYHSLCTLYELKYPSFIPRDPRQIQDDGPGGLSI